MLCKKCGTKLKDGHVYCEKCGEPVQIVPDFNPLDEAVLEHVAGMMNPEEKSASDWKAIQEKPVQEKTVHTHSKPQSKALTPRRKLWILGIAVTLLITGGAVGFLTYRNHSYTYQFQKAQEYRDKQKISRAIEYLERAMELKPEDPAAYETLVEIYTEQHEDEQAVVVLEHMIDEGLATVEEYEELIGFYKKDERMSDIPDLILDCTDQNIRKELSVYMVSAPDVDLAPGIYYKNVEIELLADKGEIYYTFDGSQPTHKSHLYVRPIMLREGKNTIRAVAVSEDGYYSQDITLEYEIKLDQ